MLEWFTNCFLAASCNQTANHCCNAPAQPVALWCLYRSNFAPFFSLWDDLCSTRSPALPQSRPTSALVLAVHLCYVAALLGGLQMLLTYPWYAVSAFLLAYIATPPVLASAAFSVVGVPESVRYAFGGLMDIYRHHTAVAYQHPVVLDGSKAGPLFLSHQHRMLHLQQIQPTSLPVTLQVCFMVWHVMHGCSWVTAFLM